jgi:hypothetical protein
MGLGDESMNEHDFSTEGGDDHATEQFQVIWAGIAVRTDIIYQRGEGYECGLHLYDRPHALPMASWATSIPILVHEDDSSEHGSVELEYTMGLN